MSEQEAVNLIADALTRYAKEHAPCPTCGMHAKMFAPAVLKMLKASAKGDETPWNATNSVTEARR